MIVPEGSILTFTGIGDVILESIETSFDTFNFDRQEYSNQRLNQAPNAQGAIPQVQFAWGNIPVQYDSTCSPQAVLNFAPDVTDDIKKKFNITRFRVVTAPSDPDVIDALYVISVEDKKLLNKFETYLAQLSLNLKYLDIYNLRSETFTYLTSTGLSMSGNVLESTESNLLITDFGTGVDLEVMNPDTTISLLKSCVLTLERRTYTTASSIS